MFLMEGGKKEAKTSETVINAKPEFGYDNNTFTNDEGHVPTIELPRLYPPPPHRFENSRL